MRPQQQNLLFQSDPRRPSLTSSINNSRSPAINSSHSSFESPRSPMSPASIKLKYNRTASVNSLLSNLSVDQRVSPSRTVSSESQSPCISGTSSLDPNTKQDVVVPVELAETYQSFSHEDVGDAPESSAGALARSSQVEEISRLGISPFFVKCPPYSLKDFAIVDTLGTGTFGRVILVRLRNPNTSASYFAMKVLQKTEIVRLKQVEHINSERSILAAISHPFIVKLFCTYQDSLNVYMCLSYHPGGELFSHLRRAGRFSPDVTRFYGATILLAIEYLHSKHIIYRDFKPENLLLDEKGYLVVVDFGFAKVCRDRTWTLCGTPEYLSPEIIQSSGHGKPSDWWAFGILLFELLCGYPPFYDSKNVMNIYEKILSGRILFPAHVDPVAQDLILRLLCADRSKRLGNLVGGVNDVKNHPWFRGVDWEVLLQRRTRAPIVPPLYAEDDTSNFAKYPVIDPTALPGMSSLNSDSPKSISDPFGHLFANF